LSLFGKKICPICGGKAGIVSYRLAGGEKICASCEKMLRGTYDLVRVGAAFRDTLSDLELYRAKRIIDEMKAVQREDTLRFGDLYTGVISVTDAFTVPASGLEEGGAEIVSLGGKPAAFGVCEFGSFLQLDWARVLSRKNGNEYEAAILKLIPCTGAYPFEAELIAGIHKTECAANTNAWLVLELENGAISCGDRIVKGAPPFEKS